MGLDINAIGDIMTEAKHGDAFLVLQEMGSPVEQFYINPDRTNMCAEYFTDKDNLVVPFIGNGEGHSFRAGSYTNYTAWRESLCNCLIGIKMEEYWKAPEKYTDKPMHSLLTFSDCEGAIDASNSKVLLNEFKENRDKYVEYISKINTDTEKVEEDWRVVLYDDFIKAFEIASNIGVLMFC